MNKSNFTIIDNDFAKKGWQVFTKMQMAVLINLAAYTWTSVNTELKTRKSKQAFGIEATDISWPSQIQMAIDIGTSRQTVCNTVKQLVNKGVLETKRQFNYTNIYKIHWQVVKEIMKEMVATDDT